jgi:hypothetical protein
VSRFVHSRHHQNTTRLLYYYYVVLLFTYTTLVVHIPLIESVNEKAEGTHTFIISMTFDKKESWLNPVLVIVQLIKGYFAYHVFQGHIYDDETTVQYDLPE